jgi:hypothetical protein
MLRYHTGVIVSTAGGVPAALADDWPAVPAAAEAIDAQVFAERPVACSASASAR